MIAKPKLRVVYFLKPSLTDLGGVEGDIELVRARVVRQHQRVLVETWAHRCLHSTCFRISNIMLPISNNNSGRG